MTRVLFVFGGSPDDASNRYRCRHLCEALATAGWSPEWASADQAAVVVSHDLVVVHRLPWGAATPWIDAARKIGAGVVFSADDLVFDEEFACHKGILHPGDPLQRRAARRSVEGMAEAIQRSDAVLVSTEFLAREAATLGKPTVVVRNLPGVELLARSEAAFRARLRRQASRIDDRILLGYFSGSATHDADLADMAGALSEALVRFPNARLLVAGEARLPENLRGFEERGMVQRHPFVAWADLPALLATVDVNLAPLDLTRPFCHAKSEVKWLEAAAVGVPTVASAAAGLTESLSEADGCALCPTDEALAEALVGLLSSTERRAQLGTLARESLARRGATYPESASAALAPFARAASGSVTVRASFESRLWRRVWRAEETLFRRGHYLRRHFAEASHRQRHGL